MNTITRIRSFTTGTTLTYDLFVTDCPSCGVVFAITSEYQKRRWEDGQNWRCPNGHTMGYGEDEADRQRKRADRAERDAEWLRTSRRAALDQAEASERSARAYRGHITRLRNRIANGVCPVQSCRRNFANVKAHIETQHPAWAHEHPEVLAP